MRTIVATAITALALAGAAGAAGPPQLQQFQIRSLDGSGNNVQHPDWGKAGTQYVRVAPANFADGISQPVSGPSARSISNRIFNDVGQNLFSENGSTQWVWTWGQFLDHTFGLRNETPAENMPIPFDKNDPLESFTDDLGQIDFARTPAAPGTGTSRQNPAPADQHRPELHRRLPDLRRDERASRVAAHRTGGREHGEQRSDAADDAGRLPPARDRPRQCGDRAGDGHLRSADVGGLERRRLRRRAGERERRAHRGAHVVRA